MRKKVEGELQWRFGYVCAIPNPKHPRPVIIIVADVVIYVLYNIKNKYRFWFPSY